MYRKAFGFQLAGKYGARFVITTNDPSFLMKVAGNGRHADASYANEVGTIKVVDMWKLLAHLTNFSNSLTISLVAIGFPRARMLRESSAHRASLPNKDRAV